MVSSIPYYLPYLRPTGPWSLVSVYVPCLRTVHALMARTLLHTHTRFTDPHWRENERRKLARKTGEAEREKDRLRAAARRETERCHLAEEDKKERKKKLPVRQPLSLLDRQDSFASTYLD